MSVADSKSDFVPASLSPAKRQASGRAEARSETSARPSRLWAQLTGCEENGGDPVSSGSRHPVSGGPEITTACYTKKKRLSVLSGNST